MMPKRTYALPPNGRRQLEITWQQNYRLLGVRLDGKWLGTITNLQSLQGQQKTFRLQDGSRITIQKTPLKCGFSVLFNETLVFSFSTSNVSSPTSSNGGFAVSAIAILAIAFVHLWLGTGGFNYWVWLMAGSFLPLFTIVFNSGMSEPEQIPLILSFLYFFLAIRVWQRSKPALAIAVALFALDTVWLIISAITTGEGEGAIFIAPILLSRALVTTLLATGLFRFDWLDIDRSEINLLWLIGMVCRQILVAFAIVIAIAFDPFGMVWILFSKDRDK